jgi:ABC-2 type transport system permease protein
VSAPLRRVVGRRVRVVARREFLATVARPGYVATLILMPLFMGLISVLPAIGVALSGGEEQMLGLKKPHEITRVAVVDATEGGTVDPRWVAWHNQEQQAAHRERRKLPTDQQPPAAAMDLPGPLARRAEAASRDRGGFDNTARIELVLLRDIDAGYSSVRSGQTEIAFILDQDWLREGAARVLLPEVKPLNPGIYPGRLAVARLIRRSIAADMHDPLHTERLIQVLEPIEEQVGRDGEAPPENVGAAQSLERAMQALLPILFSSFFAMMVFVASGYLLDGIGEEKENRVLEVLLASLTPEELLLGKMLGLGAAGLLQTAFFALVGLGPVAAMGLLSIPATTLLGMAVCCFAGYALYASLMGASGAVAGNRHEGRQISAVWTMSAASPMFLLPVFMTAADGPIATGLSLFPLSAPIAMTLRLGMGGVPIWQFVLALAGILVTGWAAWIAGSRVFRVGILITGARPPLRTILSWIRNP